MTRRGVTNPLTGVTDGKLNGLLRSALRKLWSHSRKKEFIKSVRYKKDKRFHVQCVTCDLEMATADKKRPINKDGSLSKRGPQVLFDIDHIEGITPLDDPIYGLGPYWESMMTGELQVLCKGCHKIKTYGKGQ
jgi:hypothetical protein